ncbi:hypothetical protein JHK82_035719 [Glycine max]|nr:hypothetical protein JHK82_035719 [Glycine max]
MPINDLIRFLSSLLSILDKASMLDEALEYLKQLQLQVQKKIEGESWRRGSGDHHCKTPDYSLAWTTMIPIGQDSHVTKSSDTFHLSANTMDDAS